MMKNEKKNRVWIYVKFVLILLAAGAVGGVIGYTAAANEAFLPQAVARLDQLLAWVGLWWFLPVYLALASGTIVYLQGKRLLPQAQEEDAVFERADRLLSVALLLAGAATPGGLMALGLSFASAWTELSWLLAATGLFLASMVWVVALQAKTVAASKVIYPEKRGNVFDTRFQKDWYASCDEAERQQIGQCSFRSFKVTSTAMALTTLILCLLAMFQAASPAAVLVVGVLWLVQQLSYLLASLKTGRTAP